VKTRKFDSTEPQTAETLTAHANLNASPLALPQLE